ncbi:MAG: hypothetical protein ACHQ52_03235 [Candidatus Eisenbacteria bacterium]
MTTSYRTWCRPMVALALALVSTSASPAAADWQPDGVLLSTGTGAPHNSDYVAGIHAIPDGSGGAIVVWADDAYPASQVRALRLTTDGNVATGWAAGGLPVSPGPPRRNQFYPKVASDGNGGAIIAWWDVLGESLFVQHVTPDGVRAWGPGGIAVSDTLRVDGFDLAADGSGGAFLVWNARDVGGATSRLSAAHLDASGARVPGWAPHGFFCPQALYPVSPSVVSDGSGGALFVWSESRDPPADQIYGFHVGSDGTPSPGWPAGGVLAGTGPNARGHQAAVSDGAGGLIAVWPEVSDLNGIDLYAQRLYASGGGWGGSRAVCTSRGDQGSFDVPDPPRQAIVSDDAGGALFAWTDQRSGGTDIYANHFTATGDLASGWSTPGNGVCTVYLEQKDLMLARDGAHGAYIGWADRRNGTDFDIYLLRVAGDATPLAGWPVNGKPVCAAPGDQGPGAVCEDGSGGAILVWEDFRRGDPNAGDIYAARVTANGTVATLSSLIEAKPEADGVHLSWEIDATGPRTFSVERSESGVAWSVLSENHSDGRGIVAVVDAGVTAGHRYGYRLGWTDDGTPITSQEVWVDVPRPVVSLSVAGANPVRDRLSLRLGLGSATAARLEVFDVRGRSIARWDVGGLGAGSHDWEVAESSAWSPGIYWVRLSQGAETRQTRVALIR